MGKQTAEPTQEERIAAAMNEQGFLFSQRVRELITYGDAGQPPQPDWSFMEKEYPVTSSDGSQTRIDILLRYNRDYGVYVCLECKRSHPLYKQWVFFDKTPASQAHLYVEQLRITQRPNGIVNRMIRDFPGSTMCPVFSFYIEVALNKEKRWSHTDTIEEAFYQVVSGHTGLMKKMQDFETPLAFMSIPVVVTTAEMFEATFESSNVSLATGSIDPANLKITDIPFCAVTYHSNDNLAVKTEGVSVGRNNISNDMATLRRTVFVVRSTAIVEFLNWLAGHSGGRL